jgi:hypothetical protein
MPSMTGGLARTDETVIGFDQMRLALASANPTSAKRVINDITLLLWHCSLSLG